MVDQRVGPCHACRLYAYCFCLARRGHEDGRGRDRHHHCVQVDRGQVFLVSLDVRRTESLSDLALKKGRKKGQMEDFEVYQSRDLGDAWSSALVDRQMAAFLLGKCMGNRDFHGLGYCFHHCRHVGGPRNGLEDRHA